MSVLSLLNAPQPLALASFAGLEAAAFLLLPAFDLLPLDLGTLVALPLNGLPFGLAYRPWPIDRQPAAIGLGPAHLARRLPQRRVGDEERPAHFSPGAAGGAAS